MASAFSQEMKRRYIEGVEVREEIKVRNIKSIKQNQTSSSFSFSRKAKTGQSFVLSFKLYVLSISLPQKERLCPQSASHGLT